MIYGVSLFSTLYVSTKCMCLNGDVTCPAVYTHCVCACVFCSFFCYHCWQPYRICITQVDDLPMCLWSCKHIALCQLTWQYGLQNINIIVHCLLVKANRLNPLPRLPPFPPEPSLSVYWFYLDLLSVRPVTSDSLPSSLSVPHCIPWMRHWVSLFHSCSKSPSL